MKTKLLIVFSLATASLHSMQQKNNSRIQYSVPVGEHNFHYLRCLWRTGCLPCFCAQLACSECDYGSLDPVWEHPEKPNPKRFVHDFESDSNEE